MELCRWTAASEGVPLVVAGDGGTIGEGGGFSPSPTGPHGGQDGAPVRPTLAKRVGGGGWGASVAFASPPVGAGIGRSYAVGRQGPAVVHRVAPLDGVVAPAAAGDDRPVVSGSSCAAAI